MSDFLIRHNKGRVYGIIKVPEDAKSFVIDNDMQYLIYKIPNSKAYCSDKRLQTLIIDELTGGNKLTKALKIPLWQSSGAKLPPGKYKLLGLAKDIDEKQGRQIGLVRILEKGFKPATTLVIEKI